MLVDQQSFVINILSNSTGFISLLLFIYYSRREKKLDVHYRISFSFEMLAFYPIILSNTYFAIILNPKNNDWNPIFSNVGTWLFCSLILLTEILSLCIVLTNCCLPQLDSTTNTSLLKETSNINNSETESYDSSVVNEEKINGY